MKKILTFVLAVLVLAACQKNKVNDQPVAKWNGYGSMKSGEIVKTLWAGQNMDVGTVTYGINDNPFTILYGTEYRNDSLNVYLINVTTGQSDLILSEYIGTTNTGSYNAAAFDTESGNLFFATSNEGELYVNPMDDTQGSFLSGTLSGSTVSATFYGGNYYYIDEQTNELKMVSFDTDWHISGETTVDTVPGSIAVSDITISPDGGTMYMVGLYDGSNELIEYDMATDTYATLSITLTADTQIAYGSDNILYAVENSGTGGEVIYSIDPSTGVVTPIDENEIIPVDIGDLTRGPTQ